MSPKFPRIEALKRVCLIFWRLHKNLSVGLFGSLKRSMEHSLASKAASQWKVKLENWDRCFYAKNTLQFFVSSKIIQHSFPNVNTIANFWPLCTDMKTESWIRKNLCLYSNQRTSSFCFDCFCKIHQSLFGVFRTNQQLPGWKFFWEYAAIFPV